MSYSVSIVAKDSDTVGLSERRLNRIRNLFPGKKPRVEFNEVLITYPTKAAAYTAAKTVRSRVHGLTAGVLPSAPKSTSTPF